MISPLLSNIYLTEVDSYRSDLAGPSLKLDYVPVSLATSAEMIGVSRAYAAAASSVKNSENPCAPAVFAALFAGRISVEVAVDCLKLDPEDVAVSSA